MINDKREKNNKKKFTNQFLLPNNKYSYKIKNDKKKTIKKKS